MWPDKETRNFLTQCAIQDEDDWNRGIVLRTLTKQWPDEETRLLLVQRALQDEKGYTRGAAFRELAEMWPDKETRSLLTQRALQDQDGWSRSEIIKSLVKQWPDEETRLLLAQRVLQDKDYYSRGIILQELAKQWPNENTYDLLGKCVRFDGAAASLIGGWHSTFGQILFSVYLDASVFYLDPTKPIPRYHFKQAVKKIRISVQQIDEMVQSLSEHMGWDITKGSAG